MEQILNHQIFGYHQYVLCDPVHLNYASQNLCNLIGVTNDELVSETEDLYKYRVHPSDHKVYEGFIASLMEKEQILSAEYRLVKQDGSIIFVKDTVSSKKDDNGVLIGYSVLTDITEIKNESLRIFDENIPFGCIRYTCTKEPRITYINFFAFRNLKREKLIIWRCIKVIFT